MQRHKTSGPAIPWDDVRLFLALSRARTLGAAAKVLAVDTSTVSRRLAALETHLGASLFDRDRDGIRMTSAAEALLPVAEEIEHAMARFAGAAEELEREVTGLVRIACPPDVAEVWIAPRLPALTARFPELRIEIVAGEALVDVARRAVDMALRTVRPQTGDLVVRKVVSVGWVPAASGPLAKRLGRVRRLHDVPWITFGEGLAHAPPARWLRERAPQLEPRLRSDSLRLQVALVKAGLGAALLPSRSVAHYGLTPLAWSAALRRTLTPFPEDELFLVTHRALRKVPRVHAVWESLLAAEP